VVVLLRSLSIICNDLGILNIEIYPILSLAIDGLSIEQWANQNVEQFQESQELLSLDQKRILSLYLKKVEQMLKL